VLSSAFQHYSNRLKQLVGRAARARAADRRPLAATCARCSRVLSSPPPFSPTPQGRDKVTPVLKFSIAEGSSAVDPYIAFRRRVERMQTRKVQSSLRPPLSALPPSTSRSRRMTNLSSATEPTHAGDTLR
jgi:hypothetical protein